MKTDLVHYTFAIFLISFSMVLVKLIAFKYYYRDKDEPIISPSQN